MRQKKSPCCGSSMNDDDVLHMVEDSGGFGEVEDECICELLVSELEIRGNVFENKELLI